MSGRCPKCETVVTVLIEFDPGQGRDLRKNLSIRAVSL